MKIAFYSGKMGQKHASRIIELLKKYVPHHQYNHYALGDKPDLWHCLVPHKSLNFIGNIPRSVVTMSDLRFVTTPHLFSFGERIFTLPLYRYHCRHAAKLIAHNSQDKRRLLDCLGVDDQRVEICPSLQTISCDCIDHTPTSDEMLEVRAKFELPETYVLVMGEADTMHDHGVIIHAILSLPINLNIVVSTRRTTHSDVLLRMARDVGAASRVQFIYEMDGPDRCSLYRMALVMIYMPAVESTVAPIIEALHQGVPMILSDMALNRETAGAAAKYVPSHDQQAVAAAIKAIIYSESFRGQLIAQCWAEAKRYSKESIAEQLAKIYESV
ncbi:MAG: glycosyltransferase [Rikenellaceae bacterium]